MNVVYMSNQTLSYVRQGGAGRMMYDSINETIDAIVAKYIVLFSFKYLFVILELLD